MSQSSITATFSLSGLVPKRTRYEPMVRPAATVSIGLSRDVTLEGGVSSTPLNGIAGAASGRLVSAGFSFRFDAQPAVTKAAHREPRAEPARAGSRSGGSGTTGSTGASGFSTGVVKRP